MLRAEDVSPTSSFHLGPSYYKDLEKAEKEGIICSIQTIRQNHNNLEGEDLLAFNAEFKRAKTNKLNHSMEILTPENKAATLSKTTDPPSPTTNTKLDTKHELLIAHNSKQLSASYLYRSYVSHKSEVEAKLAERIAMRYREPGTCPEIG